jgi:DNA-binding XRE family transcriptional regulator
MKLDQYKLQTAKMECGKAHFRIAQQAGMSANTLRRIERNGRCNRNQCDAIAAAIDIDPRDLMKEDM